MIPILLMMAAAQAQTADGRVLGHFGYGDIPRAELADAPAGFAMRQGCRLRREVLPDLQRLLDAARANPAVGGSFRALSCHRDIARQTGVFAGGGQGDAGDRAISVAPPGHSEHTTGYAIDFAVRPLGNCRDAEACMAATAPYRWLVANAARFGFEQSFPAGNAQGVKWEPWHWRWVGTTANAPGAPAPASSSPPPAPAFRQTRRCSRQSLSRSRERRGPRRSRGR